jgi:hypothetical protein
LVVSLVVTSCGVTAQEPVLSKLESEEVSVQSVVSLVVTSCGVTAQEPVVSKLASEEVSVQSVVSAVTTVCAAVMKTLPLSSASLASHVLVSAVQPLTEYGPSAVQAVTTGVPL